MAKSIHVLRRFQLFDPGHMDIVAGELLSRAPRGGWAGGGEGEGLSLEELQLAASLMQKCGRRADMRAFQGYFVRAVQDRQQLQGRASIRPRAKREERAARKGEDR